MKFKATLIAFLFSINLLSEDQLYVVDLILIKYLPEFETNEIFTKPIVNFPDNMTFLRDFPYPELEIYSVPFDLDYQFKDLFMSIKIDDDNEDFLIENETESDISTPTLKLKRSIFEIDSARKFSLGAEVSKIAKSRDFRVISTKSWFQNIKMLTDAELVFIDSGFFKGSRIFGFIQLYKERFLHFNSQLYFSELDPLIEQNPKFISGKDFFEDEIVIDLFTEKNQKILYEAKHSKKFRSGEIHYMDHPKFGMLIKLTKAQKEFSSADSAVTKDQ